MVKVNVEAMVSDANRSTELEFAKHKARRKAQIMKDMVNDEEEGDRIACVRLPGTSQVAEVAFYAGADGFHARHIRIAGAAGLALDFAVFLAFGFASALALAFASAFAAGVAGAASCLNGQFSREQDPVRLNVKHTWLFVRPEGLGVLGRFGVSGVFLE